MTMSGEPWLGSFIRNSLAQLRGRQPAPTTPIGLASINVENLADEVGPHTRDCMVPASIS